MIQLRFTAVSLLLALIFGVVDSTFAQSEVGNSKKPCPDKRTYSGKYRNLVYGFSIVIPASLKGYWNSPGCTPVGSDCICFSDHGRIIPLATDAVIDAFVGYQMRFEWSAINYEHAEISSLKKEKNIQDVKVLASKWMRVGQLNARRFVVRFVKDNKPMIRDHVLALHKGVQYELILRTLAKRYKSDKAPFHKVINSFRLAPRIE